MTQSFTYDPCGNILTINTTVEPHLVPAVRPSANRIDLPTRTTNAIGGYDANRSEWGQVFSLPRSGCGGNVTLDAEALRLVSLAMKRLVLLAALLLSATTASAAWYPVAEPGYLRLKVGESGTIRVRAVWTGIWVLPWTDWTFDTTNRHVATAEGRMTSSRPYDVTVTANHPGWADLTVSGFNWAYASIEVVCGDEDPVQAVHDSVLSTIGRPVTLEVITPIAPRTNFTWYRGRIGDASSPLEGSGPQIVFTPRSATEAVWVLATTPCSTSMAEFQVTSHASKRRAMR